MTKIAHLICLGSGVTTGLFALPIESNSHSGWLTVQDHSQTTMKETVVTSDPSYTNLVSQSRPIVKKLPNGTWEIVFVSEIAQDIP